MQKTAHFGPPFQAYRQLLLGILSISLLVAGVRFSNGTMLLAIAEGATVADPPFDNLWAQVFWDSPLVVALLRMLPGDIIWLALVFTVIALLPVTGLLARQDRTLWLVIVTLLLTPAFKSLIQNIGGSDGLLIAATIVAVLSRNRLVLGGAILFIALCHPHQSFFIAASLLMGRYCYAREFPVADVLAVLTGLALGAIAYLLYITSLGFDYAGRGTYLALYLEEYLARNLSIGLIGFAPLTLWLMVLAPTPVRGRGLLWAWMCALMLVAALTTDVTRVITNVSLPIVLAGADKLLEDNTPPIKAKVFSLMAFITCVPLVSWAGLDYSVWADVLADMCKWHVFCLTD